MAAVTVGAYRRLFRGETSFDFAGRWRRWFALSATVILVGLISLGVRGLNFSIDFKGGTVWEVPSSASVSTVQSVVAAAAPSLGQATVQTLTNTETGQRTVEVQAAAKTTSDPAEVQSVREALAKMARTSIDNVELNEIGPSWGSDITDKALEAVIVFLVVVSVYIWLRFEGKMALAALSALVHDILVTVGIYSLSGLQVSPDTVIAFLTILGYSLYDTIVVFDRIQENTRGLASTNRLTYTDTVNISMNQVLARSLNTSLVAILPILSILAIGAWVLGATALETFGLALFVGLTTGAYSSLFIASPLLALLKEHEPRYSELRRRLEAAGERREARRRLTPAAVASAESGQVAAFAGAGGPARSAGRRADQPAPAAPNGAPPVEVDYSRGASGGQGGGIPLRSEVPSRSGTRPPPRPRKKGRRR